MLVTGCWKGRSVSGHFVAMRSEAMVTSTSWSRGAKAGWVGSWVVASCSCWDWECVSLVVVVRFGRALGIVWGRLGGSNQVDAWGIGGMLSPGNLAS